MQFWDELQIVVDFLMKILRPLITKLLWLTCNDNFMLTSSNIFVILCTYLTLFQWDLSPNPVLALGPSRSPKQQDAYKHVKRFSSNSLPMNTLPVINYNTIENQRVIFYSSEYHILSGTINQNPVCIQLVERTQRLSYILEIFKLFGGSVAPVVYGYYETPTNVGFVFEPIVPIESALLDEKCDKFLLWEEMLRNIATLQHYTISTKQISFENMWISKDGRLRFIGFTHITQPQVKIGYNYIPALSLAEACSVGPEIICPPDFHYAIDSWAAGYFLAHFLLSYPLVHNNKLLEVVSYNRGKLWKQDYLSCVGIDAFVIDNYNLQENCVIARDLIAKGAPMVLVDLLLKLMNPSYSNRILAKDALTHPTFTQYKQEVSKFVNDAINPKNSMNYTTTSSTTPTLAIVTPSTTSLATAIPHITSSIPITTPITTSAQSVGSSSSHSSPATPTPTPAPETTSTTLATPTTATTSTRTSTRSSTSASSTTPTTSTTSTPRTTSSSATPSPSSRAPSRASSSSSSSMASSMASSSSSTTSPSFSMASSSSSMASSSSSSRASSPSSRNAPSALATATVSTSSTLTTATPPPPSTVLVVAPIVPPIFSVMANMSGLAFLSDLSSQPNLGPLKHLSKLKHLQHAPDLRCLRALDALSALVIIKPSFKYLNFKAFGHPNPNLLLLSAYSSLGSVAERNTAPGLEFLKYLGHLHNTEDRDQDKPCILNALGALGALSALKNVHPLLDNLSVFARVVEQP